MRTLRELYTWIEKQQEENKDNPYSLYVYTVLKLKVAIRIAIEESP